MVLDLHLSGILSPGKPFFFSPMAWEESSVVLPSSEASCSYCKGADVSAPKNMWKLPCYKGHAHRVWLRARLLLFLIWDGLSYHCDFSAPFFLLRSKFYKVGNRLFQIPLWKWPCWLLKRPRQESDMSPWVWTQSEQPINNHMNNDEGEKRLQAKNAKMQRGILPNVAGPHCQQMSFI